LSDEQVCIFISALIRKQFDACGHLSVKILDFEFPLHLMISQEHTKSDKNVTIDSTDVCRAAAWLVERQASNRKAANLGWTPDAVARRCVLGKDT